MIKSVVGSRWFSLADATLVLLCGAILSRWPRSGGLIIAVALIPWIIRTAAGRPPVRRTLLDLPIILFGLTAVLGVWAAYDWRAALDKLWLLSAAVLLCYALSRQPRLNFWHIARLFSAVGALVGLYFLFTHNWQLLPADLALINRLGGLWMAVRPGLPFQGLHPNIAGGLIAVFAPFPVALGLRAWQKRERQTGVFAALTGSVAAVGLVFTSSRAAWVALAIGMGVWLLWGFSALIARRLARKRVHIFAFMALPLLVVVLGLVGLRPAAAVDLLGQLPGLNSSVSRLEIYANTLRLVVDYPFIGGGLAAFSGLYSHYAMVIPVFLFGYSHNLYLDLALEQGVLGLVAFLVIMVISLWMLLSGRHSPVLRWATIIGLLILLIHGLADDALYGIRGTPVLFALPGLAAAIYRYEASKGRSPNQTHLSLRAGALLLVGMGWLSVSLIGIEAHGALRSAWYANLGAVRLARYELAGFPSAGWRETLDMKALSPAIEWFTQSLQYNSENVTANYRLGAIAMLGRDFQTAQIFLERAYAADPFQRGVRKTLGYCYAWLGKPEQAARLLSAIPEARSELEVYTWWWIEKDRADLSWYAAETMNRLTGAASAAP